MGKARPTSSFFRGVRCGTQRTRFAVRLYWSHRARHDPRTGRPPRHGRPHALYLAAEEHEEACPAWRPRGVTIAALPPPNRVGTPACTGNRARRSGRLFDGVLRLCGARWGWAWVLVVHAPIGASATCVARGARGRPSSADRARDRSRDADSHARHARAAEDRSCHEPHAARILRSCPSVPKRVARLTTALRCV